MRRTDFAALGLGPALCDALHALGLNAPTPVQQATIAPALAGQDVLASAPTGSGKTLAFVLPILQQLRSTAQRPATGTRRDPRVLVLVPTRELAVQVAGVLRDVARACTDLPPAAQALPAAGPQRHGRAGRSPLALRLACVFGGVAINPQMLALRGGADALVATPGRLLDLVARRATALSGVATLVLDEADRLLDAGFGDELAQLHALLPARRQTLLFSASLPTPVQALAQRWLRAPVRIDVSGPVLEPGATPHGTAPDEAGPSDAAPQAEPAPAISQRAIVVDSALRTPLLRQLIEREGWTQVLVFVATQYASEHVADKLRRQGIEAAPFHGRLAQHLRLQTLADFKAGRLPVIVATDLAARGIDISELPVVVNHDLPRSAVDHLHRIGRTGRAGARGLALSFICADSAQAEAHFRLIEKRQGQRVPREQVAGFEPQAAHRGAAVDDVGAPAAAAGGIKGPRKSRKDKLREAAAAGGDNPA